MKRLILLLMLPILAFYACSGGSNQNQSNTDSTQNSIPEEIPNTQPQALFEYVEPQENIAKIIWEKLLETNDTLKKSVATAKKWDIKGLDEYYKGISKEEKYPSKTRMEYFSLIPGAEGEFDGLAFYKLQCYQMSDKSWTAALFNLINIYNEDYTSEITDHSFRTFHFKDGNLEENTSKTDLPKPKKQPLNNFYGDYYNCYVEFDTIGFTFVNSSFWPLRYNWSGEKFIPQSDNVDVSNLITEYGSLDYFCSFGGYLENIEKYKKDYGYLKDNSYFNKQTNEKIIDFEINDNKISAYTVFSKQIGFAQEKNHYETPYNGYFNYPVSKPVAVGFPIKNVLSYKKDNCLKDTDIKKENKDGYYIITQHLQKDKYEKRDIYISFYAKDENSDIEKIRVYTVPLVITLEDEIAENQYTPQPIKDILQKINSEYIKASDFGDFHNCYIYHNGYNATYYDKTGKYEPQSSNNPIEWNVSCCVFKCDDGKYKILTRKKIENIYMVKNEQKENLEREFAEYIWDNGNIKQIELEIPQSKNSDYRAYPKDKKLILVDKNFIKSDPQTLISKMKENTDWSCTPSLDISTTGFELRAGTSSYEGYGEFEDSPNCEGNYQVSYDWDGEKFVSKKEKLAKEKDLIIEIYSKVPQEDLHYDYKKITANDFTSEEDFKNKKVDQRNIGFSNFWDRKTKVIFIAEKNGQGYDVMYYTQPLENSQPKILKYRYQDGTLSKTSISNEEKEKFTDEWESFLKN